jgi:hypothetical protein
VLLPAVALNAQWAQCTNEPAGAINCVATATVGVGTTAPSASTALHLTKSLPGSPTDEKHTAEVLRLENGSGNTAHGGAHISFYFGTTEGARIVARNAAANGQPDGAYNLKFFTYNAYDQLGAGIGPDAKMTLTGKGQLLVGVTAPPTDATATEKLFVNGDIRVTGNINAKYRDLAEWVDAVGDLAAGTVVVLDKTAIDRVTIAEHPFDTSVAGVVSPQPGIALGERGLNKALVATTGRVRVKVDASKHAIAIGDLLTTSGIPGHAMRSVTVDIGGVEIHRPATILGKALEPLAGGRGEILVLLTLQ